jgi:hypothetical protein
VAKLNQVIAVEKTTKTRVQQEVDKVYKAVQKPTLFEGFTKTYKPLREDEAAQPPQRQLVQITVPQVLTLVKDRLQELFDVVAQKDFANTTAKADIAIGDAVIATGVPTTYLLFLEKQMTDLHTLVGKLPTLDPADEWKWDEIKGFYKTEPTETQRTRKVAKPLVLYPATPEHPAQTQVLTEDVPVGVYEQIKISGATTEATRQALLARIETMQRAVKFAREKANVTDAPKQEVSEKVLGWIFA